MCALFYSGDRTAEEQLWHAAPDLRKPRSGDALAELYRLATSARYVGLQFYLVDLPGRPGDLVITQAVRPQLRPFAECETIHV